MHELRDEAEPTLRELVRAPLARRSRHRRRLQDGKRTRSSKCIARRSASRCCIPTIRTSSRLRATIGRRMRGCRSPISTTSKRSPISSTSSRGRFHERALRLGGRPRARGRPLRSLRRRKSRRVARRAAAARVGRATAAHGLRERGDQRAAGNRGGSRSQGTRAADALRRGGRCVGTARRREGRIDLGRSSRARTRSR